MALVVALVAAGALAVILVTGDDEAAAAEFEREPVETAGDNPFMDNVGTDEDDVAPPDDAGETFEGDTPGLYGGTRDVASCDADQLVAFLDDDADKAAAFAGVLDIRPADIADFVDDLTPVVLRSDTAVTNHGFRDGRATSYPAVLQAGTAVLVDDHGAPVVKCYCGNPLTPPPPIEGVRYIGPRWATFETTNITIIQVSEVTITTFTLVDITTNEPFGRPAGTDGSQDGPPPDDPTEPPTEPDDPTEPDEPTIPTDATYDVTWTLGGDCGDVSFTVTATVADGQVTFHDPGTGETFSVPLSPDGTFTFDETTEGTNVQLDGNLDDTTLTATGESTDVASGQSCPTTLEGTRTG